MLGLRDGTSAEKESARAVQIPASHFSAPKSLSIMGSICRLKILVKLRDGLFACSNLGESSVTSVLASNALLEEPQFC